MLCSKNKPNLSVDRLTMRVLGRAHEMKRYVGLISNDPTVMAKRNGERLASFHFHNPTVAQSGCGPSGDD